MPTTEPINAEDEYIKAVIGVTLTDAEIQDKRQRDMRATNLFEWRDPGATWAKVYFDSLAAVALGEDVPPETREWIAQITTLGELQEKVRSAGAAAEAKQTAIQRAREARDLIASDIAFETERMESLEKCVIKTREIYFSHVVGGRNPVMSELIVYNNMVSQKAVAKFTREEVLPELQARLAVAQRKLDDLNPPAAQKKRG